MADIERVVDLAPHYLALLVLLALVLFGVRRIVGGLEVWMEIALLFAVSIAYPSLVRRLGIAPSAWDRSVE